jgi:predicted acylesterase/phospholipase RssA
MSRKIAIAISGAVSLGSFEAGVMYEVLEAIARYNEAPERLESDRIEIDVITGASAGGMTAGVLAQKLLCDSAEVSLREPFNNPLYNAWVEEVDIEQLLTRHSANNYKSSLLSSDVVNDIGDRYLLTKAAVKYHPSAAKEVYVGIAMSNLNGWDYTVRPRNTDGDGEFTYTHYKDRFVCKLDGSNNKVELTEISFCHSNDPTEKDKWMNMRPTSWDILRDCCLSSGAFPFAFAPRIIKRKPGEGEFEGRVDAEYTYTDGGVFENEPLGLAKKLAEWIDSNNNSNNENNEPNRFYLYIAPGNKKSTINSTIGRSEPADLWNILQTLVAAVFHQSRFQDWILKDLNDTSPIYQITVTDDNLIGEVFSAFAGFLDIRFRFFDYNIGREAARAALIKFSTPNPDKQEKPNPNLVHWKEPTHLLSQNDWQRPIKDGNGNLTRETQNIDRVGFSNLARQSSLFALLEVVDRKKRKLICDELIKRIGALIDFFNKKLDEKDANQTNRFFWDGFGRRVALKPILLPIAKILLEISLGLTPNHFSFFKKDKP